MSIYEYDEERQRVFDRQEGYEDGMEAGRETGMEAGIKLAEALIEFGKSELIPRALQDKEYREMLMKEYDIR